MMEATILNSRGRDMLCLLEYRETALRGRKVVIYKHGFCGNKIAPHRMMANLGHQLVEEGYTVIRFDCVGAGDSEGGWSDMTISGEIEDFKKLLHWTVDTLKPEKLMVIGYSMGGLETALCCREVPLDGILFWSPVSQAHECFQYLLGDERFAAGMAGQDVDFLGDRVGKEFFRDLDSPELNALKAIQGFDRPVFFIHGTADTDVDPANTQNYMNVLPGSECHMVEGSGHGYDSWAFQDELWKWSKEYIHRVMD